MSTIPKHVTDQQRKASDPAKSVWVSANAGSGKTHVLAQRVLRLLLAGVPPAKILCLTFTKAAAANMAGRVFKTLSEWTALDDAALAAKLSETGAPKVDAKTLVFARRLFARTVETPGGLKIHTIHGFCERLLHLFPFEANVPGRFEVLDDLGHAELLALARRDALATAEQDKGALGEALRTLAAETSQDDFSTLLQEATKHRALLHHYDAEEAARDLGCALELPDGTTIETIETDMIEGGVGPARWRDFAEFLGVGLKTDGDRAALFRLAAEAHKRGAQGRADCLEAYSEIFFTAKGEMRKTLVTKALAAKRPDLVEELQQEQVRLDGLRALRKAAECLEKSLALTTLVAAIFARYEALKAMRGKLDFDDLIDRTLALFERSDASWVLYKLDSGIDHILVDEAQDTSPAQWRILEHLASEFYAGAGASDKVRTFFAVGDEKQSIFSFQGAAPEMFHEMHRRFALKFSQAGQTFESVPLKTSFRSVPAVLGTVDQVFSAPAHQRGLVSDDTWMGHEALKENLPGLIEIWAPVSAAEGPEADGDSWKLPLDLIDESDPANILAQRVAKKIAALVAPASGELVYDGEAKHFRPISAGDILILVRTRNAFFDAIIRALKQVRVPVAGADRLDLLAHIAVMDLIAAGHAALLPQDDLTLAAVLKSPLIGFDDDDLLRLAPGRAGSLFAALASSDEAKDKAATATLLRWRARAPGSAFEFYARLLSEDGGRRMMEARLGPEACDAMDEFLRLALRAEKEGTRALSSFLAEIESLELSIKRDMESAADAVRVMTVHAAKGLEAKVVFLPDTCGAPGGRHDSRLHVLDGRKPGSKVFAWSPRQGDDPEAVARARQAARDAAEDEHRRLLYVAMTRAEERLYISGFFNKTEPNERAWARMIAAVRDDKFVEVPAFWDEKNETIWRYAAPGTVERVVADARPATAADTALPAWLSKPAPREAAPLPPLRPSNALAAGEPEVPPPSAQRRAALQRGRLVHTLLQYLPEVEAGQRRAAAKAFLDVRAPDYADAGELIATVLGVLEAPALAGLFGPHARAEAAVAGTVTLPNGATRDVLGQIDRIAESEREVILADYKTGAPVAGAATPESYIAQMALYRALLAPLWPDKHLRCLLIWTTEAEIAELSAAQLDAALARLV
ncbi:double-strand break repair helicase AddA [Methylovirgula ligni]|uniref:DNA 3'-5' helicase n=1 Tax=Methylovirgula ligni TaxID=569860 RepID=A0A3D9YV40_9HYPH|nr:double-strand break repair helicase AddA [Methylovirgula ligni]QAY97288.1 double-strand break repair helicase AddA [Methylovirgula ligni]REF86496.1 DNA helicase/exodeoxyribonuclease V subunit A [Methylovirgula ligni]